MSALPFAFSREWDRQCSQAFIARGIPLGWASDSKGQFPRDSRGRTPCIPPAILRGMVDRILTRARVERDNREEAQPSR
jgi:hypothetical protein